MSWLLSLLAGWKRGGICIPCILLGLLLVLGIYQAGVNAERKRGEAAALRVALETVLADRRLAEQAQLSAADKAAALATINRQLEGELDDLRTVLAAKPEADRCPASGADIDLLYGAERP